MDIQETQKTLKQFAIERDWEQFHSPKNLAMALAVEASELMEIFQWLTEEQSKAATNKEEDRTRVEHELADIQIYLLRLADELSVDLEKVVTDKIQLNAEKYPVELSKGSSKKYNQL